MARKKRLPKISSLIKELADSMDVDPLELQKFKEEIFLMQPEAISHEHEPQFLDETVFYDILYLAPVLEN
jgi:hypothetical protein